MQPHSSSIIEGNKVWRIILTPGLAAIGVCMVVLGALASPPWGVMLVVAGIVLLPTTYFLLRRVSRDMHRL